MINVLVKILGKSFENKSAVAEVVHYSKKVSLLRKTDMPVVSTISLKDLTGVFLDRDIGGS